MGPLAMSPGADHTPGRCRFCGAGTESPVKGEYRKACSWSEFQKSPMRSCDNSGREAVFSSSARWTVTRWSTILHGIPFLENGRRVDPGYEAAGKVDFVGFRA